MLTALALPLQGLAAPVELTDRRRLAWRRAAVAHGRPCARGDALRSGQVVQRASTWWSHGVRRPGGSVAMEVDSPNGTDGPEPVALIAKKRHRRVRRREAERALARRRGPERYDLRLDAVDRRRCFRHRAGAGALHLPLRAFAARNEGARGSCAFRRCSAATRVRRCRPPGAEGCRLREQVLGPNHYDRRVHAPGAGAGGLTRSASTRGRAPLRARARDPDGTALGPTHPGPLSTQTDLGYLHPQTGDHKGRRRCSQRSLARREAVFVVPGAASACSPTCEPERSQALLKQDQPARAEEMAAPRARDRDRAEPDLAGPARFPGTDPARLA